jgi:hypothetical protein
MSNSQEMCIRIMPRRDSRESPGRHCDWSHRSPGHEERMEAHQRRIRGHVCLCGSGLPYGECCLDRMDQEYRELRERRRKGRQR